MGRFCLGSSQFVVLVAGLLGIACVFGIVFAPQLNELHARLKVQQFEQRFGFTTGPVLVPNGAGGHLELWGIAAVAAGGSFDLIGVRAGDVPFEYHGHAAARLLDALRRASAGERGDFEVGNAADWMRPGQSLRHIVIAAVKNPS